MEDNIMVCETYAGTSTLIIFVFKLSLNGITEPVSQ